MVGVLLTILQIIGIVAASIGGLLCFALSTPLKYDADIKYHGSFKANARISWMLKAVRIFIDYPGSKMRRKTKGTGQPHIYVKIFMLTVWDNEKAKKAKKKKAKKRRSKKSIDSKVSKHQISKNRTKTESADTDPYIFEEVYDKSKERRLSLYERMTQKIKNIYERIISFFEGVRNKIHPVLEWLDADHRRLISFLWKNGLAILKRVRPKDYSIDIRGGTGNPYTTGQILGWVGLALGMFGIGGVRFEPDFEKKRFDADAIFKGSFFVIPVIWLALKIYRNKDFKRFILKKNI